MSKNTSSVKITDKTNKKKSIFNSVGRGTFAESTSIFKGVTELNTDGTNRSRTTLLGGSRFKMNGRKTAGINETRA